MGILYTRDRQSIYWDGTLTCLLVELYTVSPLAPCWLSPVCAVCCDLWLTLTLLVCRSDPATSPAAGQQGIIVRTIKSHKNADYSNYEDAIKHIDCTRWQRRLGIRWEGPIHLWLVKDICGIICAVFTWLLVFYAEWVICTVMIWPAPTTIHNLFHGAIFQMLAFLAVASHIRAMLTDPVCIL